jgi:hypothetical protein
MSAEVERHRKNIDMETTWEGDVPNPYPPGARSPAGPVRRELFRNGRGLSASNDGTAFASQLATTYLNSRA